MVFSFWFLANKDSEEKEIEQRKKYIEKKKKKLEKKNRKKTIIIGKSFRKKNVSEKFYNKQKLWMMSQTINNLSDASNSKNRFSDSGKKSFYILENK
jgi:uncharacterized membrane protein YgaE (UPF0421/DUF939 family)